MRTRDENKEQAIRKKALQMIVKEGFDGLSMQKLAKAASVSPATIYIYFKDREDLIVQLCIEQNNKMSEATLENFDPSMSFSKGLRIQWMNRAKYCLQNPEEMYFLEQIRHSPFYDQVHKVMADNFKKVMKTFVCNAVERGEIVKVPVEVYWSIAFAPLYNLVKFQMAGRSIGGQEFVLTDEIIMQTLELVLKALKP
jgi:AraC-like DNA-binding protein